MKTYNKVIIEEFVGWESLCGGQLVYLISEQPIVFGRPEKEFWSNGDSPSDQWTHEVTPVYAQDGRQIGEVHRTWTDSCACEVQAQVFSAVHWLEKEIRE